MRRTITQAREHLAKQDVLDSLRLFAKEVMPHFSGARMSAAVNA